MVTGNVETMEKLVRHTCLSHTLIKSIDLLTQYSTITIHHSDYKIHHSDYKNRLMNSQFVCLVLKGGK